MILSFEEIKNLTFGAINIVKTEKGICFYRLTERQIKLFSQINEFMGIDAKSTAGIRLDFICDGSELIFTVGNGGKYEVLVDGVIISRVMANENETVSVCLGDAYGNKTDKKRVTIAFPGHSQGILKSVEIKDCSFAEKHKYNGKILFLGDSITQGWNTFFNTTSYVWRLALISNSDFVNQGIGRTYYLKDGLDKIPFEPDKVIVSYGTNDWARYDSSEKFKKNVIDYYDEITRIYKGREIYVISPIWRQIHTERPCGNLEDLTKIIKDLCEEYNFTYINGLNLVPPLKEMFSEPENFLHPNDLGMASYAENLYKAIFLK